MQKTTEVFQRQSNLGGLSIDVVFAKQSAHAAAHQRTSIVQRITEVSHGRARLNLLFSNQSSAAVNSGFTDDVWQKTDMRDKRLLENLPAVETWFKNAPITANALLITMSNDWASPDEANAELPVKVDDWFVYCTAGKLVGAGNEPALMKFIGHLYRLSPRQAALALHAAQRETVDFYRDNGVDQVTPLPTTTTKKETSREIMERLGIVYTGRPKPGPLAWHELPENQEEVRKRVAESNLEPPHVAIYRKVREAEEAKEMASRHRWPMK
jgi:hypothetical protein